jgi:hypothetical protein
MRRKPSRPDGRGHATRFTLLVVLLAVLAIVVTPVAALAQDETAAVVVPAGSDASLVVVADGDALVRGSADTVIALSGDVIVAGTVRGTVLATDGQVRVRPGGRVQGDVYSSVTPTVEPGGVVTGAVDTVDVGRILNDAGRVLGTLWWLATTIALLALGALLTWALPRVFDLTVATGTGQPGPAALTALVVALGVPALIVLLAVTVVGIPLALALILMLLPLYLLGQIAASWIIGVLVLRRADRRLLAFVVGLVLLQVVALVPVLGVVSALAVLYGLGALAVTAWRSSRATPGASVPAAPRGRLAT